MEDGIFFNQSKYIKEMLKKFGLEDSKPMKTPMSSDTKLMKDEECESVDSAKYRGMIDFAQILRIPCEGACVFSDRWSLDELVYGSPLEGPYQTNLPSPDDIISYIREDREELQNESYVLYDRVMNPLSTQLKRKPSRNCGTTRGRHSASSSTFNQPSLSHLNDDDDGNNKGTSRASTPSPIRPLNPQPRQSNPSLDITLSLSPITPLDHIYDTPSPPSPPQPQPPIIGKNPEIVSALDSALFCVPDNIKALDFAQKIKDCQLGTFLGQWR
nr:retrovirus-related Pol polyprotein from transposon TNT 1-94 [Tanacetum cinerariifolium]